MVVMNIKFMYLLPIRVAALGLLMLTSSAYSQITFVPVKTESGCAVSVVTAEALKAMTDTIFNWSGACLEGEASGPGIVTTTTKTADYEIIGQQTGRMYRGKFYGYFKSQSVTTYSNSRTKSPARVPNWAFIYGDRGVGFAGLGLTGNDAMLNEATILMPSEVISWDAQNADTFTAISIYDKGTLMLMKMPCDADVKKFPECSFDAGKQNYDVFRFTQIPISGKFENETVTYCPLPKDFSSCQQLIASMTAPYVASINAFIKESIPKVADLDASVRSDLAAFSKRQTEAAASKAQAAAKASAELAGAEKSFRDSISKMNAGQLFAKADELSSQGDKAKAREVLRTLVSRFPDHPLAATAAQQMAALGSAANNAPTTENVGGQGGGNSGGSGNVCNGQIPSFIQEKWGRFSNSSIREVFNGTVKPLDRGMADAIRIMGTKAKALQDFESNLADWKVGIVTAADGYCKIQTGCSDHIALLKTWPQALPANMPNSSRGAGASESFAAAYVAQALAIDYFTALKQYFQCQNRTDSTQPQTAQRVQPNQNAASRTQTRNPQTISAGPVSATLIPTNNPVGRCYDIAYENRGDKHVDIFVKFTLTNNKTGEKGTSDWFGDNTRFDGLFGSANINKMNPKTHFDSTRTDLYLGWLLAQQNFKFSNSPADYYGFNNIVESCDDITAEMPAGGLKWNENAYQRHYDANNKKR